MSYYPFAVKILGAYLKPKAVFPLVGLGHKDDNSEGSKAVVAIKIMCIHNIQISVMDEAAAIDGSRPLEQVADACGYAWGSTNLQMSEDMTRFRVLLMTGKSFKPAEQAWPPLVLEGATQLQGKRAQRKLLGPMRSLLWTDHANFTKQQSTTEIDCKMLRWTSAIIADGSEIKSLAGRAARLGDGTSRNPKDRDALLEQRSKELSGLIGQVRGLDLEDFLNDLEETGTSIPWVVGDDGWISSTADAEEEGPATKRRKVDEVIGEERSRR